MIHFSNTRRHLICGLGALACAQLAAPAGAQPLPGDSVYQLKATLTDHHGRSIELAASRGQLVLASMFYSSCEMVCPMLFETIRMTLDALPAALGQRMRVLMISFDPQRDTVPALQKTAQAHGCDARWTLARCDERTARDVAAALGVQYRRLASGEFNHSSTVELLDLDGRIAARSGQLGGVDPAFVKAIRQTAAKAA